LSLIQKGEAIINSYKNMTNSLSFSFKLIMKEIRNSKWSMFLNIVIFSFIFLLLIASFLFLDVYKDLRLIPYQTAQYDIHVSGDISQDNFSTLKNSPAITSVVGVKDWGGLLASNPIDNNQIECDVWFVDNMDAAGSLTIKNRDLLLKGEFEEKHGVISYSVARMLKLNIGDTFCISWKLYGLADQKISCVVSGIVKDSAYGRHIVIDQTFLPNQIKQQIKGPDYTSLYLTYEQQMDFSDIKSLIVSDLGAEENYTFSERLKIISWEQSHIENVSQGGALKSKYGMAGLYVLVLIFYIIASINRRKKIYAILHACGIPKLFLVTHYIMATFLFFLLVNIIGLFLAIQYYKISFSYFWSLMSIVQMLGIILVINLIVLVTISAIVVIFMNRISIPNLLKE